MTIYKRAYFFGIGKINQLYVKFDRFWIRIVAIAPFGPTLYYSFFNCSFRRELKANILARIEYDRAISAPSTGCVILRRNIHRLEKGLTMKNRRPVFATDYIQETVRSFCQYREIVDDDVLSEEYQWFRDVLAEYFKMAGQHPNIQVAKEGFLAAIDGEVVGSVSPFVRDLKTPLRCDYQALLQLVIRRRSVRWFRQKKVPRELIEKALLVGLYAPSACNRQPFEFRVFNEPTEATEVARLAMGVAGYEKQIPCTIVVVGKLDAYFSERDRHVIYIDASLAVMGFMMALETLGLSSCAINWPDINSNEKAMQKKLKLDAWERPVMQIAVGYPDEAMAVPRSVKKTVNEIIKWKSIK